MHNQGYAEQRRDGNTGVYACHDSSNQEWRYLEVKVVWDGSFVSCYFLIEMESRSDLRNKRDIFVSW